MTDKPNKPKGKRSRPETRTLKINATPEFVAKCVATPIKKDRESVHPNDKKGPSLLDMP